jgi:hypothetical protein
MDFFLFLILTNYKFFEIHKLNTGKNLLYKKNGWNDESGDL